MGNDRVFFPYLDVEFEVVDVLEADDGDVLRDSVNHERPAIPHKKIDITFPIKNKICNLQFNYSFYAHEPTQDDLVTFIQPSTSQK